MPPPNAIIKNRYNNDIYGTSGISFLLTIDISFTLVLLKTVFLRLMILCFKIITTLENNKIYPKKLFVRKTRKNISKSPAPICL